MKFLSLPSMINMLLGFVPVKKTNDKEVVIAANKVIFYHAETLRKLEQYDRGEIKKNSTMVRYPSVPDYVRRIQATSGQN